MINIKVEDKVYIKWVWIINKNCKNYCYSQVTQVNYIITAGLKPRWH